MQGVRFLFAAATLALAGCALVESPAERARHLASDAGMQVQPATQPLLAYLRPAPGSKERRLTIYIESDGAPWPRPDLPPFDPTPHKHIVLGMAISDASAPVAYLGRPCQYLDERSLENCDPMLWTLGRFREDAVAMSNVAVDKLKRDAGASRVNLVGYSGGGTMAALLAARRNDVSCLVTLASPLDTEAWTRMRHLSPLRESLNPADVAERLSAVPQTHFRGRRDTLVPPESIQRYLQKTPKASVVDVDRFTHECCWDAEWVALRAKSCLAMK